jgi:4-hydroxythreonine-4-phosphate dehydrogenase
MPGDCNCPDRADRSGEPAGIGPDLCLAIASSAALRRVVCLADRALLAERAQQLGIACR